MELLTGEFRNTLDDKGRVSLPSRMRSELPGNMLIITQGIDRCLWLFPPEQWKILSRKLMDTTSPFLARARLVQRRIIAPAQEVEIDKAGRLAIPQSLREFARLTKDCVILGIEKYVEIWDSDQYKAYWDENEAEFQAAAEELGSVLL
ncbi:MAG: cell division/cell wall cluster transcriptional repressor MraZ [Treponema sp. GWB1_62_6]|nr:MAG: cell division/cell wall cluster transcriptional repressor MraZ [Treponema sp. GWB1_62_6]OHE63935.1 MAG: cell division/cell wall cluster transcriptional repressor MraZ [Treponema sp. GWC1_61_84]OHE65923.1 MAG: cell division/cell wall cluster transcriptional repressor MraZ [Treponema sp. GWA1_62_8]OHE76696.1 MAG: cell division/cell wall cluster transcriptional repressor MraZ [Treponema sp. RIFOXYC1_FULL_61_9]HCM25257.1 cell division/cell wall cluster transcriptional repressor MraZ [Trepon